MEKATITVCSLLAVCASLFIQPLRPQEKPDKQEPKPAAVRVEGPQIRVQVVFSEYEGSKKVKSLPYTLVVPGGEPGEGLQYVGMIRMGSRVPVATAGPTTSNSSVPVQFQYIDVGTNIDCRARIASDGRYALKMSMERSWFEEGDIPASGERTPASSAALGQPIVRQFKADNFVVLRDGQSAETTLATDPVSGKVIKVEISLTVMK
jgi:hypothetical protein